MSGITKGEMKARQAALDDEQKAINDKRLLLAAAFEEQLAENPGYEPKELTDADYLPSEKKGGRRRRQGTKSQRSMKRRKSRKSRRAKSFFS
jgi:hypothetical protein